MPRGSAAGRESKATRMDGVSLRWGRWRARRHRRRVASMGGHSPLARHTSTPAELQARIEADRAGTPYLVLRDGDGAQALVDLAVAGGAVTVGRRPSCDLNLHWDPDVSRLHARLERVGDEWTVVDDGT